MEKLAEMYSLSLSNTKGIQNYKFLYTHTWKHREREESKCYRNVK